MGWWYREPLRELVRGDLPKTQSAAPAMPDRESSEPARVVDSTRDVVDVDESAPPAPEPVGQKADTEAGSAPPGPAVPVSQLPDELRSRLPPLAVSVVSFSGDVSRRFVMIDGGIYKEGDQLPAGIRVERILRDRIELSMLSERFYINP